MTTSSKKRSLPWLLTLSLFTLSSAQDTTAAKSCANIFDCNSCLAVGPHCVFAVGECFDLCQEPDNGATCYSSKTFTTIAAGDICELYATDNSRCVSQRTCEECTGTIKSDGKPCHWYASAGETGTCFGGGTGPFGPGALACPPQEPPVALEPEPTTPSPTPYQSLTADDTFRCQPVKSCEACLDANCVWFGPGTCAPSCAEALADYACYAKEEFPDTSSTDICQTAVTTAADRELCYAKLQCGDCTSTVQSDGTNCQWYEDEDSGVSWCQIGGCDENSGVCGSDTCADGTNRPPVTTTDEPETTDTETDGEGETPVEEMTETNNMTTVTDGEDGKPDGEMTGAGGCNDFDGYGSDGCVPCLSSPNNCAWVLQTCVPSCGDIADAPCYAAETFPNMEPQEICDSATVNQEDVALCGSKNYCFTCTATILSDGQTTCSWYTDGDGEEWCDVGGCNGQGICGNSDEAVCQPPEEMDNPAPSPTNNNAAPDAAAASSSSATRKAAWSGTVLMCMAAVATNWM